VHIHRSCATIVTVVHECDPPVGTIDLDTTLDFYCRRTCLNDGCNQHLVKEISSNANEYLNKDNTLVKMFLIIWVQFYLFFSK
jgi:hypothetical protein